VLFNGINNPIERIFSAASLLQKPLISDVTAAARKRRFAPAWLSSPFAVKMK